VILVKGIMAFACSGGAAVAAVVDSLNSRALAAGMLQPDSGDMVSLTGPGLP
jgi:hypothetical protein